MMPHRGTAQWQTALALTIALGAGPLLAAGDEPSLEEIMQGFDDSAPADTDTGTDSETADILAGFDDGPALSSEAPAEQGPLSISGSASLSSVFNTSSRIPPSGASGWDGLSRLRAKLGLQLDYDIATDWQARVGGYLAHDGAFGLNGRADYTDEVLESFENEAELGEAWLQGRLTPALDIKLGRQIVVWGKSDNLRVTDVLNPMDMREPGMVDIEDLRLPVFMSKLDYYWDDWNLSAIAIHEHRFNELPPFGSDYYPYPAPAPFAEIEPSEGGEPEWAVALNGTFSGWDLSLYWADYYDDTPYLDATALPPVLRHPRITMTGVAGNWVQGNWLLKGELALFDGLAYRAPDLLDYQRRDILLGFEYSGLRDTTLALETVQRTITDHDAALAAYGVEAEAWTTAARYSGEFLHARLKVTGLIGAYGAELDEGGFHRISADYDIADGWQVTGGFIGYRQSDANDRLFAEVKYSF